MRKQRPINLDLTTIRFPITAWASIAHRLSGIVVFLAIPGLLWTWQTSLASEAQFLKLKIFLVQPALKIGLWLFLMAITYHWIAGVRHLLLDLHIGITKLGGRLGAQLVMIISVLAGGFMGYWLW